MLVPHSAGDHGVVFAFNSRHFLGVVIIDFDTEFIGNKSRNQRIVRTGINKGTEIKFANAFNSTEAFITSFSETH